MWHCQCKLFDWEKLPVKKEGDHLLYSLGRKHLLPEMHMARHKPERGMAGEMQQPLHLEAVESFLKDPT